MLWVINTQLVVSLSYDILFLVYRSLHNMSTAHTLSDSQIRNRKMRQVLIAHYPRSEIPYRVERRRNGMVLGSFNSRDAASDFIDSLNLETLEKKTTRKTSR